MKNFSDLSEQEMLALAISLEEEDSRIYDAFAHGLQENYPDTAKLFRAMADEESGHRHRLLDLFRTRLRPRNRAGEVRGSIPLIATHCFNELKKSAIESVGNHFS
jgi:rubrerythrin